MNIGKKVVAQGMGIATAFISQNLLRLFWKKVLHKESPLKKSARPGKTGVQLVVFTVLSAAISALLRLALKEKGGKVLRLLEK